MNLDIWPKMVVPPVSALLPDAATEAVRNEGPSSQPEFLHQLLQHPSTYIQVHFRERTRVTYSNIQAIKTK